MKSNSAIGNGLLAQVRALNSSHYQQVVAKLNILSKYQTLEELSNGKCSFSRFGEGEFRLLLQLDDTAYERHSPEKAERLMRVLHNPNRNFLLGVNASICNRLRIDHIKHLLVGAKVPDKVKSIKVPNDVVVLNRRKLVMEQRQYISSLLKFPNRPKLGDSSCFTMSLYLEEYRDNKLNYVRQLLENLFRDRKVTLVSNMPSYFEFIKTEPFLRFKLHKHIPIPRKDAYEEIDKIADSISKSAAECDLILMQAGAVGTILASELSQSLDCQILDIGLFRLPLSFFETRLD